MKSSGEIMDIIAAYREVGTYRGAAEVCGTTHKTVRRIIEKALADGKPPSRKRRDHNYDAVADLVSEKIKAIAGKMSAKRLLPLAQAAGYAGSARNFRRLVAEAKKSWRRGHHRGRRPAIWTPGQMLVIDWGDAGGGLHVFCTCSARCWPGRGCGSCVLPATSAPPPRWRCWPSALRRSAGCRRWCWPIGWAA